MDVDRRVAGLRVVGAAVGPRAGRPSPPGRPIHPGHQARPHRVVPVRAHCRGCPDHGPATTADRADRPARPSRRPGPPAGRTRTRDGARARRAPRPAAVRPG